MITDSGTLGCALTAAALACLLALASWPANPQISGAETLRDRRISPGASR